jgi:hypothetical protein
MLCWRPCRALLTVSNLAVTVHTNNFEHYKILHSARIVFICFVWISDQTVNFALNSIQELAFIMEMASVYSAVRTGSLNRTVYVLSLKT